ncbi:MAG: malate dehydrogenase [Chloroflexota bacterium]
MGRKKVSIIGAGMTGSSTAAWLAAREICDVVMLDIVPGVPQGRALDLQEAMPVIEKDVEIVGTDDYAATANSDVVVITAGVARKPGMSRDDLMATNAKIVQTAAEKALYYSPDTIFLVLTNPLDVMAYLTWKATRLPPNRVVGQAGVLDAARMRTFVSMELGVSVENVQCFVLGGHGDEMVPLTRHSNVAGLPLKDVLSADRLEAIVERTRKGGAEVINYLGTSAYYAPAASVVQMVDAIIKDKHLIVPASAYLTGQYGLHDMYFGVPVQLGSAGVEKVMEYDLNDEEKAAMKKSAEAVQQAMAAMCNMVEVC